MYSSNQILLGRNGNIGQKMANSRLLFQALLWDFNNNYFIEISRSHREFKISQDLDKISQDLTQILQDLPNFNTAMIVICMIANRH